nr:type 1 glutamine amidotransferase [uncultured Oscillibacter sp.]
MEKTVYIWGGPERFANYRRWVESAGGRAVFGDASDGQGRKWDALLLPGGGDLEPWRYGQENTASRGLEPERDEAELRLLQEFTALGKPVLGVCRGLQTINVFFGGTLAQDVPGHGAWEEGDRLHGVRTAPSPLRPLWGERMTVNSAHHQAADRLGSGLRAVQWTGDGVVEALCHERLPVWAVQWHPERLGDRSPGRRLMGAFLEGGR